MSILPHEDYQLITSLPEEEVVELISGQIEPQQTWRLAQFRSNKNQKPYEGVITGNIFKIIRIIRYRNSFLPMISGTIKQQGESTRIHIEMKIMPLATLFITLLIGVILIMGISFLFIGLHDRSFLPAIAVPVIMFGMGYFMVYWGFKLESAKSKKFLRELFRADEATTVSKISAT